MTSNIYTPQPNDFEKHLDQLRNIIDDLSDKGVARLVGYAQRHQERRRLEKVKADRHAPYKPWWADSDRPKLSSLDDAKLKAGDDRRMEVELAWCRYAKANGLDAGYPNRSPQAGRLWHAATETGEIPDFAELVRLDGDFNRRELAEIAARATAKGPVGDGADGDEYLSSMFPAASPKRPEVSRPISEGLAEARGKMGRRGGKPKSGDDEKAGHGRQNLIPNDVLIEAQRLRLEGVSWEKVAAKIAETFADRFTSDGGKDKKPNPPTPQGLGKAVKALASKTGEG
jgi:hypothetical protein